MPATRHKRETTQKARALAVRVLAALTSIALSTLALAQTPFIVDQWKLGRRDSGSTLSYCVDQRDPDWPVARDLAQQIAGALLLEPKERLFTEQMITDNLDNLYRILQESCDLFMGFKLIPDAYPDWMTLTRAYYRASYVVVVADGKWKSLADVPRTGAIAATLGTSADLRLTQYLMSLRDTERWQRFPMANDEAALRAVLSGTAQAALVWEPAFQALRRDDPAFARLRAAGPAPLPAMTADVGAALLSSESFLRTNVDQAIAALAADGTLARIFADHKFPGRIPQDSR